MKSIRTYYCSYTYLIGVKPDFLSFLWRGALIAIFFIMTGLASEIEAVNNIDSDRSALRVIVISEDDGTGIIGATTILSEPEGDTLAVAVTDVHGFAEFPNLQPGQYDVHISFIGYESALEEVNLGSGEIRIVRIELKTATTELGEVQVSAIRGISRREAGRQTISPEQISRIPTPGSGGDLSMFLQSLPGVVTTGDRGGELFIRGGTPAQNIITVDNMPIIKPFHISNLFSAFPNEALSGVDLYAGGFGAKYAGATSSVIDVHLRQGNMRQYKSKAAVSPYIASLHIEGPIKKDEQSFFLMGRHSLIEETGPTLANRDVPLLFYDFLGRYSVNWDGLTCNINGIHTFDRGLINPVRDVQLSWTNTVFGTRCLGFSEELGHAIDFTIGYTAFNNTERGLDDIGRQSGIKIGYLRVDNALTLFNNSVDYGFNLNFINYTAVLDEPFAEQLGRGARFLGLTPIQNDIVVSFSTYITHDWNINRYLSFETGAVTQFRLRDVKPTFEPRLRFIWRIDGTDRKQLTLATGRYMQMFDAIHDERDAGTVFYVYKPIRVGDPFPESLHAILGYRHEFSPRLGFSIESFVKDHKNIPVAKWTREPGNTLETGLASSYAVGGDVQIEFDFAPLYISLSYGLAKITFEAPADEIVAWIDEPVFRYNPAHDRRHQINAFASYRLRDYTFNANFQLSSGSPYTRIFAYDLSLPRLPLQRPDTDRGTALTLFNEPFDGRLPSFNRLDVSVNRTFRNLAGVDIETEIGAINALNVQNVFYFDVNTNQQVDQLPAIPYMAITFIF